MKITDDEGRERPATARRSAASKCAGRPSRKAYFRGDGNDAFDADGWFDTGDVATIDPDGYMQITDRSKDVIKSGGEWISSIEIENIAVGHPAVAEAAVIGIPSQMGRTAAADRGAASPAPASDKEEMLALSEGKIAKWWMPDDVVFVDEIPHTATGKIQKLILRERFGKHRLPGAA